MTDPTIVRALENFAREPASVVEGALIVSQIIDPGTDPDWCRAQLAELAQSMPGDPRALDIAHVLHERGFHGAEAYYKSENSALAHVLKSREGIPISLAIVILGICEQLELEATGVNFPSHFLVSIAGTLLDPFTMTVADEQECRHWLEENKMDTRIAFTPASAVDTILRMLNNLSGLARAANDSARALELSDYKLALHPGSLPVYLERTDLWLELGVVEMARRDLSSAIELAQDEDMIHRLRERLQGMAAVPSKVH
jgi:regulator of sirC expression with transglutaminase-like and TPR domain